MKSSLIKHAILPVADKVMKTNIAYSLKQIKYLQKLSRKDLYEWQCRRLTSLVNHAYNNTTYYRQLFDNYNLNPGDINLLEDLRKLPRLKKEDIRNNFNDLIPNNIKNIPHKKSSTGGSTGNPLIYLLDNQSWSFSVANNIVNWEKTGYQYGDKFIALGSSSLFIENQKSIPHIIYYKLKNKIGLNGVNMSDEVCQKYLDLINRKNIKYIYGYASSIYLLSKYVLKNNIVINIDACFPTSEVLTDIYRESLIKAFKCKILNVYGANDGGITAFEHDSGCFEVGYNSLISGVCESNHSSKILLTDLLNYSMPLINYQIGDEVVMKNDHLKKCNYNGQVIEKVLGRSSDLIELENGSRITGPGFTILFKDLPVEYYCIEKVGYNSIKCTIKKIKEFDDSHEKVILSTFKKNLGADSNISITYSNEIKYTKSGKIKYFG